MPYNYVIEMFCDFIGAGKAYLKEKWTTESPLAYWKSNCENSRLMHQDSERLLVELLNIMANSDKEETFYDWYKNHKKRLEKLYKEGELND